MPYPREKTRIDRRKPLTWMARIGLASGVLLLGYFGVTSSIAYTVKRSNSSLAYRLAPYDGVLAAAHAQQEFALQPSSEDGSSAVALARRALRLDGTAVEALNLLGFQAQLAGSSAVSDAIFAQSTALTRRELRAQLWGIEEAVSRGDVAGALRQYDLALRTSTDAKELLFPTLTAALSESKVRRELLKVLATKPSWSKEFIQFASTSGNNSSGAARLFDEGRDFGLPVTDDDRTNLVNSLARENDYEEAWMFYSKFRTGADRARSRDPNFVLEADVRSIFDWSLGDQASVSAAISKDEEGGRADFFIPPSVGGVVLQQTQLLRPGLYRMEGTSFGIEQPLRSRPYWKLQCVGQPEGARLVVPNSSENNGVFSGQFVVPPGCPVQVLQFIALPSDKASGVSGQITSAQLIPAR